MPAFANDGVAPPTNPNPPPHDRLVDTPMACMMPSLPSPYIGGGSPVDAAKMGVTEVVDFAQDVSIYLGCLGNKAKIVATAMYMKFMASAQARLNAAQKRGQDSGNQTPP